MIDVENLQKIIDQRLVIDIKRLRVEEGEIAALVGRVGSGKDTLLDLLIGRSKPTLGALRLADVDPIDDHFAFSQRVGILFEEDALYQHRSPVANLVFACHLRGLPKSRAVDVLAEVGLADHANAKLNKLSSSLKRRLAFGRAILHAPQVLLLVNPFDRCDEATITLLQRLIRQCAEADVSILILADDTAHLLALCDVIYELERGQIVEVYEPEEEKSAQLPFKVPVRLEGRVALVNPSDILYALVKDGQAWLQTTTECLPTQFTLTELETRLARSGFFRAHRSYLVNLQRVKEVIPYTRNSYSLILDDAANTEIPLSKSSAGELRELLGY
jgi:ABC-2 type transport system ATP-binding protein